MPSPRTENKGLLSGNQSATSEHIHGTGVAAHCSNCCRWLWAQLAEGHAHGRSEDRSHRCTRRGNPERQVTLSPPAAPHQFRGGNVWKNHWIMRPNERHNLADLGFTNTAEHMSCS
ncbi:hypothetical protein TRAPUB_384 [Trametes pubescens]|uniref:Uncharacterized protein n=1 Tax=Trametes pubescens TaxID=154538 RepID=A0A1M2VM58_TRAPU|nr:hypothetical protein TRAPUB_384 [Trametes pubescens]